MRLKLVVLVAVIAGLTSCKKSDKKERPDPGTQGIVSIQGRDYKTVKIGTQTWSAESYSGTGGMAYGPNAKPEYGKYYTYNEVKAITLPDGWRIPSMDDYRTLGRSQGVVFAPGTQNTEALKKLISKSGWTKALGTNSSGFNAFPANLIYQGQPAPDGDVAEFWTATGNTFSIMQAGENGASLIVQFFANSDQLDYRFPVRFVKD